MLLLSPYFFVRVSAYKLVPSVATQFGLRTPMSYLGVWIHKQLVKRSNEKKVVVEKEKVVVVAVVMVVVMEGEEEEEKEEGG